MAEVVGLVLGLVALVPQLTAGVKMLRQIRNADDRFPVEIDRLACDLELLVTFVEALEETPGVTEPVLQRCCECCTQIAQGLDKVRGMVSLVTTGSKSKRVIRKITGLPGLRTAVEALQQSVTRAQMTMMMTSHLPLLAGMSRLSLAPMLPTPEPSPVVEDSLVSSSTQTLDKITTLGAVMGRVNLANRPQHPRCGSGSTKHCPCSCHRTSKVSRRYWAFEYIASPTPCDYSKCQSTVYGASFRVTLTQVGLNWSVNFQAYIAQEAGSFSLQPSLVLERTVPYNSPGFDLIRRCSRYGSVSPEVAQQQLLKMARTDSSFRNHVNPSGWSYLEITMIKFFFTELNITKGLYSPRLLPRLANFSRHNSRSNLLKCLITLGFDPSESPAPAARFWPRPSLVKIGGKHAGADPFSLENLAILCRLSPGFAEMTPLHEAVLLGTDGLDETRTSRSPTDERNFLGQTPLHLALSNTGHMTALINSGHDINALDRLGMTPLMYAGIMGLVNAVLLLLDRGADPSLRATKHNNLFIDFAASRNNWDVIMAALSRLETRPDNDTDWTWARHATILRHVEYPDHTRRRLGFKDFLAKCDTPNFIFDHNGCRGSTLMHFVTTPEDVQTLLGQGFTRINQANSDGHNPFMRSMRRHREVPTILPILNAGTDVHHRDNNGHTALWYALYMGTFQMANCSHESGWRILHHVLQCGIDALSLDDCLCPCSPNGCLPSSILHWSSLYYSQPTDVPWPLFEWLIIVLEYRGSEEAKTVLLSYIRRAKHDELGLTHLCCTRFPGSPPMDGHVPPLPSDDIDDILAEEEELSDLMEQEMEEAKALNYDQLKRAWFTQVKGRLDAARADEGWSKPGKRKEEPSNRYHFGNPIGKQVAAYKGWVDFEFECRKKYLEDDRIGNSWYDRRISHLRHLVKVMGVKPEEVSEHWYGLPNKGAEELF